MPADREGYAEKVVSHPEAALSRMVCLLPRCSWKLKLSLCLLESGPSPVPVLAVSSLDILLDL